MGNNTAKIHTSYSLTKKQQSLDIPVDRNGPESFSHRENGGDLVLVIEGMRLHVHREILAEYSPVFAAMLNDDFKERDADEIPLPGKSYIEYRELLRAIYCHGAAAYCRKHDNAGPYALFENKSFLIHNGNVIPLLSLSDEYQIDAIKDKCEEFLSLTTTRRNAAERLYLAELYDLKRLLKTILPIAARIPSHRFKSSPYYDHISEKVRISVQVKKKYQKKIVAFEDNMKMKYLYACKSVMAPFYSAHYLSPSSNVTTREICYAYTGLY